MASDNSDAYNVLRQWIAANPGREWNFAQDSTQRRGQPGQPATQQPAQNQEGNWGIWIDANNRFANQPGEYARGETPPLIRFPSRAAAELWVEQQRAERPNMRADIEVREIAPRLLPGSTLDLQRQQAAQAQEIPEIPLDIEIAPQRAAATNPLRPTGPGPWEVASRSNNQVYYNPGHQTRMAAQAEAERWLLDNGHNPNDFEVRTREGVRNTDAEQGGLIDVAGDDWSADFERRMQQSAQASQTLTRPGQGQQVFTGEWKVVGTQGQELYRFSGVGNSQADANRVAQQWVNTQRAQGNVIDARELDVLPVMGDANAS